MEQAKDILEAHVGEYILGNYVENLRYSNNATGPEKKTQIKQEEYNKLIKYILTVNLDQSKYAFLENGLAR